MRSRWRRGRQRVRKASRACGGECSSLWASLVSGLRRVENRALTGGTNRRGISRAQPALNKVPGPSAVGMFELRSTNLELVSGHGRRLHSTGKPPMLRQRYLCRRSDSIQASGDVVAPSPPAPGLVPSESRLAARGRRSRRVEARGSSVPPSTSTVARSSRADCSRVRKSSIRSRSISSMSIRIARPTAACSSPRASRRPWPQRRNASSLSSSRPIRTEYRRSHE